MIVQEREIIRRGKEFQPLKQYARADVEGKYESTDSSFKSSSCICHASHTSYYSK